MLVALTGCGAGSGNTTDETSPSAPTSNSSPTIVGTPGTQITAGQRYSFIPTTNDSDGDTLTFSIENQPTWSSFDIANGSLTGTPGVSDVGITSNITISVSDDQDSASLAPFDLEVQGIQLGSALISWDTPTTSADGSDLDDLAGFNVHYGQEPGTYTEIAVINDDAATSSLIEGLDPGSWFFAVSAFDLAGNRSALSAEVSKVVGP